jgi:hypothetical protein
MEQIKLEDTKAAVVKIGDGRGFVVEGEGANRLVITAAHCLPFFPPCFAGSYLEERTYQDILGPLDGTPVAWAECLFVDPVSDLAVLGPPDNQDLAEQFFAYESFVDGITPLLITNAPEGGFNRLSPVATGTMASMRSLPQRRRSLDIQSCQWRHRRHVRFPNNYERRRRNRRGCLFGGPR